MKRTVLAVGVLTIGILGVAGGAMAGGIRTGKWSMTTAVQTDAMDARAAQAMKEMDNMPPEQKAMMQQMMGGMKMKMGGPGGGMGMTTTSTQCISNDNPVPEGKNEQGCKQTHTIKGNTVEFEVVCADSRSTGQVTYDKDSMKGTIKSTHTEHGQQQNMTVDISGQYVGPCS